MIKPDDIRHLRTASSDYAETETLKAEFRMRRSERNPYREEIARLAVDLGWSVQETDLAIWEYDRRRTHHSA